MSYSAFRPAALLFLCLQALGIFGLAWYTVFHNQQELNWLQWLSFIELLMFGVVVFGWQRLFRRATSGQAVTQEDGLWRSLQALYPPLTSIRFLLWGLWCLMFLMGGIKEINPVALTGILTIWGVNIVASNACFKYLLSYSLDPTDLKARFMLMEWLNFAGALSFGLLLINLLPIAGYNSMFSVLDRVVYGVVGLLDVVATVLAWATLRMGLPWSFAEELQADE